MYICEKPYKMTKQDIKYEEDTDREKPKLETS